MLIRKEEALLQFLQDDFPLEERPFLAAGRAFHMTEEAVLRLLQRLQRRGVIRYLGGIFDTGRLGVKSVLCAMDVAAADVERVAGVISGYPNVSHNYLREGHPNLWFTLSASSRKELLALLKDIGGRTGLKPIALPAKKTFKIDARFDLSGKGGGSARQRRIRRKTVAVDKATVISMNKPMDICPRPFEPVARALGMGSPALLARLRTYLSAGVMRRFGLILSHRHTGLTSNCMVVWRTRRTAAAAAVFKRIPQITHCYEREPAPGWPYNLYTMIHCRSKQECGRLIAGLASRTHISDYRALSTRREFKKTKADLAAIL